MPPVVITGRPIHYDQLAAQMRTLHVPAISVALIHDGKIQWARGFGVERSDGPQVTADTLFQAGSISKPLTALEVLHFVQKGKLALNVDVNRYLRTWKVPTNEFTQGAPVTLRELLSHTAGITVHGFPGYAAGQPIPSLVDVLNGTPPANSPAIRVDMVPGKTWRYSGGGYVIVEQLLEDVTREPFATLMHDQVLRPLGMSHSTYDQPLPSNLLGQIAIPYGADGYPVAGGPHVYPEQSAAGLWTTPSDLARFALDVAEDLRGRSGRVVSAATARTMLTPVLNNWGLGLAVGGATNRKFFTHGGADEGYQSVLVAYDDGRDGAVIMTNSDRGAFLGNQILRTLAYTYHWPDFMPLRRAIAQIVPARLDKFIGYYHRGMAYFHIYRRGGDCYGQITGQMPVQIFPEGPTEFFATVVAAELTFDVGAGGNVTGLVLHQNGLTIPWRRVSTAAAEADIAERQQRIKANTPSPGTEVALRHQIETLERGEPDYSTMGPQLAEATRQQLPQIKDLFKRMGGLKSLVFSKVLPNGVDLYIATFEHGQLDCMIAPLSPAGKVVGDFYRQSP
jgi:CubicO group peptidase (beta-lactamase class C family)